MDAIEGKKLKVGDKVYWGQDINDIGTVTEVSKNGNAIFIVWKNQAGWIHVNDLVNIHVCN